MATQKIYTDDIQIAKSLIKRDEVVTRRYYYEQCYPLFKSIYDNYYTDCKCCKEFMDEIYILVIAPSKTTGRCQMENFRGESTLTSWLKAVCIFYCKKKFKRKKNGPVTEPLESHTNKYGENDFGGDRDDSKYGSIEIDLRRMNHEDVETLLDMMPNARYRKVMQLRHLEQRSNEDTAKELGISMDVYYNVHKRAINQYKEICRKEEKYG